MSRHKVTVEIEAEALARVSLDQALVERTFLDAVDEALGHVAGVLGDTPAWVICVEALDEERDEDDPRGRRLGSLMSRR
ncbi:MAG TPA: hypothetical protein VI854_04985 [Acidimicrobiia bacterium]|nr:hypothetical protein [Acidimicrobiia bacterium]